MSTWQFACGLIQQSSSSAFNSKWEELFWNQQLTHVQLNMYLNTWWCSSLPLGSSAPSPAVGAGNGHPPELYIYFVINFLPLCRKRLGSISHWWAFLLLSQLLQLQIGVQLSEDIQVKFLFCGAFKCNRLCLLGCKHPQSCPSTFLPLNN